MCNMSTIKKSDLYDLLPMPDMPLGIIYDLDRYVIKGSYTGAQVQVDWKSLHRGKVKCHLVKPFLLYQKMKLFLFLKNIYLLILYKRFLRNCLTNSNSGV